MKILVRATNWIGDAVMSLPALRALAASHPDARLTLVARPWVASLYEGEKSIHRIIALPAGSAKWTPFLALRRERFDLAVVFPNSLRSAAQVWLTRAPRRVGYARDARNLLLTDAIPLPKPGETPPHERFYYLELLRRAGLIARTPDDPKVTLESAPAARLRGEQKLQFLGLGSTVIGVSPGAAFGSAKRWLPERFAETASRLSAQLGASIAIFGSAGERELCAQVANACGGRNLAGSTSLRDFIDMTAACTLFLSNDSGAMHIAAALNVPSVTVFGPTDETGTGPCGDHARLVRNAVECAPCKLRECPIDHRCMTRVSVDQVVEAAMGLVSIRC